MAVTRRTTWLMLGTFLAALGGYAQAQEKAANFFLPKNPVAAAYILGRLSNQELIDAPRSEFVYAALLQRPGLDRKYRVEALDGLAQLHHTDRLTELLAALAVLDKKADAATGPLQDLTPILLQFKPAELAAQGPVLEKLAESADLPRTRQLACAALITADGSVEPAWAKAESKPETLADLLLALPLLRDSSLIKSVYGRMEPLLHRAEPPQLRRAAMIAIVAVPGHEVDTFKTLAQLIEAGTERATAVTSLQRLPQASWPKEEIGPLLKSLMDYLQTVPAAERSGPEFTANLQFAGDLASFLPVEQAKAMNKTLRGLGPAIVRLRAVYEQLRYDKQLIVVEAGKPVAITLENQDAMPHNLAILAPGALEEIGLAAEKLPAEPDAQGRLYIPSSPKVLWATRLVPPGQTTELAFTAPAEPGDYPYVCTFPGHWRRMTGTLTVVKDLETYLASHAEPAQTKITEWRLEDLSPELGKVGFGRNLDNGQKLFTQLACVQCHKLRKEGYAYGPELTAVFAKYKNDRTNVLQQILEPSKVIEDRYRNYNFELKNGEPMSGMILQEDDRTVTIQTGPADSLVQRLNKSEIERRQPSASSPMPLGLLNSLSKEQILDLLAYLESGGQEQVHQHSH